MADKRQQTLFNFFRPKDSDEAPPKIASEVAPEGDENVSINASKLIETTSDSDGERESPLIQHQGQELTAYEMERLHRIQRNMEIMRSLGLANLSKSLQSVVSKTCTKIAKAKPQRKRPYEQRNQQQQDQHRPLRRSARQTSLANGLPNAEIEAIKELDPDGAVAQAKAPVSHKAYDITHVHEYIAHTAAVATDKETLHSSNSSLAAAFTVDVSKGPRLQSQSQAGRKPAITSFVQHPTVLRDAALARAYSIDWVESGFIVAGGKDGQVSVWGTDSSRSVDCASTLPEESIDALISHRLHSGWISDVQWTSTNVSSTLVGNNTIIPWLLTSANDGLLCLWDLEESDSGGNMPRCIARTGEIHSAGIFSMHESQGRIATASKDSCVVISSLSPAGQGTGFTVVQRYNDIHDGVVKCVRWNRWQSDGATVFASCGNDRVAKITDTRCSPDSYGTDGEILLDGRHTTTVNCIRWNPLQEHMLLSSSHDSHISIHDIRKPGDEPVFKLLGHANGRLKNIYQPAFIAAGTGVVASGEPSSRLSLWSLRDGKLVSQGIVDGGVSLNGAMHCPSGGHRDTGSMPVLCSATRSIFAFQPVFKEPAD
jgi:WD40 repeat protein